MRESGGRRVGLSAGAQALDVARLAADRAQVRVHCAERLRGLADGLLARSDDRLSASEVRLLSMPACAGVGAMLVVVDPDDERLLEQREIDAEVAESAAGIRASEGRRRGAQDQRERAQDSRDHGQDSRDRQQDGREDRLGRREVTEEGRAQGLLRREAAIDARDRRLGDREQQAGARERVADQREIDAEVTAGPTDDDAELGQ